MLSHRTRHRGRSAAVSVQAVPHFHRQRTSERKIVPACRDLSRKSQARSGACCGGGAGGEGVGVSPFRLTLAMWNFLSSPAHGSGHPNGHPRLEVTQRESPLPIPRVPLLLLKKHCYRDASPIRVSHLWKAYDAVILVFSPGCASIDRSVLERFHHLQNG